MVAITIIATRCATAAAVDAASPTTTGAATAGAAGASVGEPPAVSLPAILASRRRSTGAANNAAGRGRLGPYLSYQCSHLSLGGFVDISLSVDGADSDSVEGLA